MQHIYLITHGCFVHVSRTHDHAQVLFLHHLVDDDPQVLPGKGIHPHCRFIQQQQVRGPYQGTGQAQFLLHAARQLPGQPVCKGSQPGHIQQFGKPDFPHIRRHPVEIGVQIHVLLDGQILVQAKFLRHITDPALDLRCILHRIQPQYLQTAPGGIHESADQPHGGGLPRPVRPDQRRHPALFGPKVNAFQGMGSSLLIVEQLVQALGLDHPFSHGSAPCRSLRWQACPCAAHCPDRSHRHGLHTAGKYAVPWSVPSWA